MKKVIQVQEVDGEGLEGMLGQRVFVMCTSYFYSGLLVGVNSTFIKLDDCHIVYETGSWSDSKWMDAQKIGDAHYLMVAQIESFRVDPR